MPGQAVVTIGTKQWTVPLATTLAELTSGLGGISAIPAGSGMLFDLGSDQIAQVTTVPMLFSIDIVFINSLLEVVDLAESIAPGYVVASSQPARYFLEVNAGEASGVEVGDEVGVQVLEQPVAGIDMSTIVQGIVIIMMLGMMIKVMGRTLAPGREVKKLKKVERKALPERKLLPPSRERYSNPGSERHYGPGDEALHKLADAKMENLRRQGLKPPDYGVALVGVGELAESLSMRLQSDEFAAVLAELISRKVARGMPARELAGSINVNLEAKRLWRPADRAGAGTRIRYLEYAPSLKEKPAGKYGEEEHRSIHGPMRQRLVEQYGSWAVGRAEAVCPEDDVACVRREAIGLLSSMGRKLEVTTKATTIPGIISESIGEELHAASAYKDRASAAEAIGDTETAELFEHLASDERHHVEELKGRLGELPY